MSVQATMFRSQTDARCNCIILGMSPEYARASVWKRFHAPYGIGNMSVPLHAALIFMHALIMNLVCTGTESVRTMTGE